jgi:Raf kinase inhibitor-like YbhB/YbcL family protein
MQLFSSAFRNGETIPARFTCDGANISPPLNWSALPPGTASVVIICDDADAPSGTWSHWAVFDIPASVTGLSEGASSDRGQPFSQGINDFKQRGYGGPCPPRGHGPHHYRFRLMALSVEQLRVSKSISCRDIERAARRNLIAEADLVGTYER